MKRKLFFLLAVVMLLSMALLAAGCGGGKMNMLMGRWKLSTAGDENGNNQDEYPFPISIDIYPDGRVEMLDTQFGRWTMNGDNFTFKSDDGKVNVSGGFRLEYPKLTVYLNEEKVSYVLEKQMDLAPLVSMERSQTPTPAPVATATPAPSAAATASN